MAGTAARGRKRGIVGINVTPMVDVVLVLLVIMMVSATYIVSQSLKVELPKTSTSDQVVATTASVTITKDGDLLFDQSPISEQELIEKLRGLQASGVEVNLVVSADTEAMHGHVVRVIDLAKLEGITKFAIRVERKG